jgi:hypothetical protein
MLALQASARSARRDRSEHEACRSGSPPERLDPAEGDGTREFVEAAWRRTPRRPDTLDGQGQTQREKGCETSSRESHYIGGVFSSPSIQTRLVPSKSRQASRWGTFCPSEGCMPNPESIEYQRPHRRLNFERMHLGTPGVPFRIRARRKRMLHSAAHAPSTRSTRSVGMLGGRGYDSRASARRSVPRSPGFSAFRGDRRPGSPCQTRRGRDAYAGLVRESPVPVG